MPGGITCTLDGAVPKRSTISRFENSEMVTTARAAAADADRLVSAVADRLTGGAISPELRASIVGMVNRIPADAPEFRVAEAVHGVMTSLEYAVLR